MTTAAGGVGAVFTGRDAIPATWTPTVWPAETDPVPSPRRESTMRTGETAVYRPPAGDAAAPLTHPLTSTITSTLPTALRSPIRPLAPRGTSARPDTRCPETRSRYDAGGGRGPGA